MPWRMIGLVLLLVLVAAFATLNLSNRTDISLGLYVFREVPIFLSLLVAFLAGILVMVPFTIARGRRRRPAPRLPGTRRPAPEAAPPFEEPSAPEQTVAPTTTRPRRKAKPSGIRKSGTR